MRHVLLSLIILACLSHGSEAAGQTTFQKTFGGIGADLAYSIQQTTDNGFIIAGYTLSFGAGNRDVYLIRTDECGATLWSKVFGQSNTDYAWTVDQTTDGGFIVGAHTGSFGAGGHDVYLLKCKANGDLAWTKTFGGSSADGAYSLQQTSDGGYIISAHTSSFGAGQHEVYLIKTDSIGDTLWTRSFGGTGGDFLRSVQQTSDGGYIAVSETFSFGVGGADVYLVRTDSGGNLLWAKAYGGNGADYGYSVRETSDGGIIVAGYTSSFGAGAFDVYLFKTDSDGVILWSKTFGGTSSDYGHSIKETADSGFVIAGYSNSFGIGADVYLIRTDANGNHLWSKTFGGNGQDIGWSVQQTSDGGYAIGGHTASFGAGSNDVYLIKTDELGNSGCHESIPNTVAGNAATTVSATQTTVSSGASIGVTSPIIGDAATVDSLLCASNSCFGCCVGVTGNIDNDMGNSIDIADLTFLIDHLFINFPLLDCPAEGNVDGDGEIDIADLTALIDHLFINFPPTADCQ